jgi:hypothetical protein
MGKFVDFDGLTKRAEELDDIFTTYDPTTDTLLIPKWEGEYKVRILPVLSADEFLRQYGQHWNVFPSESDKGFSVVGCPKFTHGQDCPICDAINKAVSERKVKIDVFKGGEGGKGNMLVKRQALLRVLLLDFTPDPKVKKPPKFTDLPQLKVISLPLSMAKALKSKLQDKDIGAKNIIDPVAGKVWKLKKSEGIDGWWDDNLLDPWPIPEEFLESDDWPEVDAFLPVETTDDIMQLIEKFSRNIHPIIANNALSIDMGTRRIEAKKPSVSKADLKRQMEEL